MTEDESPLDRAVNLIRTVSGRLSTPTDEGAFLARFAEGVIESGYQRGYILDAEGAVVVSGELQRLPSDAEREIALAAIAEDKTIVRNFDGHQLGAFPSIYPGEPPAVIVLRSDRFVSRELDLVQSLADGMAFAQATLRLEAQREVAEARLKESESRYRSLVDLLPDAIIVHRAGKILFNNAMALHVLNIPPEIRLVGRNLADYVLGESEAEIERMVAAEPVDSKPRQVRLARFDGESVVAEVSGANITFRGSPARLLVVRDVSERAVVEGQLVQAAKLATLGEMAASLAHELSQPINIMRMSAESTLMFFDSHLETPEDMRKQLQVIEGQARRMAEIIDHIRVFSRKDSKQVQIFDALGTLRLATDLIKAQAESADIQILEKLPNIIWPVAGHPVQLEQVMVNLLANAVDAIKERRAEATGHYGEVILSAEESGGRLIIRVKDNGIGLPESILDRIFEPFFTTKAVGQGTGLGLSVSFGIVTSMGGQMRARNHDDGAIFTIDLPRSEEPIPKSEAPSADALPPLLSAIQPPHVMIVDDEPLAAEALAMHLGKLGCRVTRYHDGLAAWTYFQDDPADVVVTDLRMPRMDGHALISKLRDYDPLQPIVVATGDADAGRVLGEDADDRLVLMRKPVSPSELWLNIRRLTLPP